MRREAAAISPITEIIAAVRAGEIVVLVDDEDRENEGDLVFAADFVTPEKINFLARHGRGLICMPISEAHAERLGLKPMVAHNRSRHGTNFTVSIEAAEGIATGISAHDRALTVKVAASPEARAEDIVQPGHVFPLIAQPGGVLVRAGHTEACCDLARLAGLTPAAVLCEIMRDDGSMARLPDLVEFAAQHRLKIGTIAVLIEYRSFTFTFTFTWTVMLFGQVSSRDQERYDDIFRKYSKRFFGPAFDWQYFKAQALAESGLDPNAKSPVGARGVMQLMPGTYALIKKNKPELGDITDPEFNIGAGIMHSRGLWHEWNGHETPERLRFMFGSYNAGEGPILRAKKAARAKQLDEKAWTSIETVAPGVERWRYRETLPYVRKIEKNYRELSRQPKKVNAVKDLK
jgi:3,4-dihydroxy-2-butanone 4-phosphate synthase